MTTAIATPEKKLTTEEAAALLGVLPETLASWRCLGRYNLPYIKVGRAVRYDRRDIDAWLASRRTTAVARASH